MDFGLNLEGALLWIVLLPLAGAVVNGVAGRAADRALVGGVAVGTVACSFLLSVLCFLHLVGAKGAEEGHGARLVHDVYEWFSLHLPGPDPLAAGWVDVPVRFRLVMDSLSGVMALIVTGIGLLIHVYALGYMADDEGFARFFTYLNLFMASMLVLVLASNLPLMFVGWEGVGLCSYLLIGFWYRNADYAAAGRKAFVMNRIGDFGVLIGMFVLVVAVGSFEFEDINAARNLTGPLRFGRTELGTVATVAALFLFLGCSGKSAQIPLYTWLPDAMAGPTPVSALIHAATMVTAGVYLCCRLSPVFALAPTAMAVIAIVGALTAFFAATVALVQTQMKKILAYSTVSQLGFMFAAVGTGAFAAGIFHVYTHAFFKACLFLGAGSVMHAVGAHGDADVRRLGGLRRVLPQTHLTFLLSCLAIAGVPLTSGFFSKDEILLGAAALGYAHGEEHYYAPWIAFFVFAVLTLAATLTAFYMFRLYFLTFSGSYRSAAAGEGAHLHAAPAAGDAHHAAGGAAHGAGATAHGHAGDAVVHDDADHGHAYAAHPHESPPTMTVPLLVLGAGAILAGYVGLPAWTHANLWLPWLEDRVATLPGAGHHETFDTAALAALAAGTLAMAVGVGSAWALYGRGGTRDPLASTGGLYRLLLDKWRVDELYGALFVRPTRFVARLSAYVDQAFVDGLLTRASSGLVRLGGFLLTRLQTGYLYAYGAAMALGIAFVAWWFTFPHAVVEAEVQGGRVVFVPAPGLGYEYRWDLDSDGEPEGAWSRDGRLEHAFTPDDRVAFVVRFDRGRNRQGEIRLGLGESRELGPDLLGAEWQSPDGAARSRAPLLRVEPDCRLVLRPNDAAAAVPGASAEGEEVPLEEGRSFRLGRATVTVAGVVRPTLEVRSAFGNVARRAVEVVMAEDERRLARGSAR